MLIFLKRGWWQEDYKLVFKFTLEVNKCLKCNNYGKISEILKGRKRNKHSCYFSIYISVQHWHNLQKDAHMSLNRFTSEYNIDTIFSKRFTWVWLTHLVNKIYWTIANWWSSRDWTKQKLGHLHTSQTPQSLKRDQLLLY